MIASRASWTAVENGTDLRVSREPARGGPSRFSVVSSETRRHGGCRRIVYVVGCQQHARMSVQQHARMSVQQRTRGETVRTKREQELETDRGRFWGRGGRCSLRPYDWPGANRDSLDRRTAALVSVSTLVCSLAPASRIVLGHVQPALPSPRRGVLPHQIPSCWCWRAAVTHCLRGRFHFATVFDIFCLFGEFKNFLSLLVCCLFDAMLALTRMACVF